MKKLLTKATLCVAILWHFNASAQNNVWYFGGWPAFGSFNPAGNVGLAFTGPGNSPVQRNNENGRAFYEGCTVVSDSSGNVLFYSDGVFAYNINHVKLGGGVTLLGGQDNDAFNSSSSSAQGALSVPDPGNSNRYYLFTTEDIINPTSHGMRYNIIDMTLNGGLGDFVPGATNVILRDGTTQKCTESMAAIAKNCDTTWIVTHVGNSAQFAAYPLTPTGIGTPVVSSAGPSLTAKTGEARGTIAFSPNGNYLGMAFGNSMGAWIFNFDKQTGIVSSNTLGPSNNGKLSGAALYGTEWSPDGKKFYFSDQSASNTGIRQYNIETNSVTIVTSTGYFGEIVRGPDGKLYIGKETVYGVTQAFPNSLATISTPNASSGTTCGFNDNGYPTGAGNPVWLGLPQTYFPEFDTVTVTKISPIASQICDSTSSFYLNATPVFGQWSSKPSGFVDNQGKFIPGNNSTDSTDVTVYFGLLPCIPLDSIKVKVKSCCSKLGTNPPSGSICPGDSIDLSSLVTDGIGDWSIFQKPAGTKSATITAPWFKTNLKTDPGTYQVTFTRNPLVSGCQDTTLESIIVTPPPTSPALTAGYCPGESVDLIAGDLLHTYLWSPGGSTSNQITVSTAGNYIVTKKSNSTSCISVDTIVVSSLSLPTGSIADTSVCDQGKIVVNAGIWQSYLWDDNTTKINDTIYTVGEHWVIVENSSSCKDTIFVQVNSGDSLTVSIGIPGALCTGASLTLNATVSGKQALPLSYNWDGVTGNSTNTINSTGDHNVVVTDARNCKGSDKVTIASAPSPDVDLKNDTAFCFKEGATYLITLPNTYSSILWMDGTTNSTLNVTTADTVIVTVSNGTCSKKDTVVINEYCTPIIWKFPNWITPNDDGSNDKFIPFYVNDSTKNKLKEIYFVVYDRWGVEMYKTSEGVIEIPMWDGKYKGNIVSSGVYYYIVRWTDKTDTIGEETGWIQVVH